MNPTYERKIAKLILGARPRLGQTHGLEFKPVFGAVGAFAQGQIFATCGKFGFALKLPPRTAERLLAEKGTKPLKYFAKGHVKRGYVVLPPKIMNDTERFRRLVGSSVRLASHCDS